MREGDSFMHQHVVSRYDNRRCGPAGAEQSPIHASTVLPSWLRVGLRKLLGILSDRPSARADESQSSCPSSKMRLEGQIRKRARLSHNSEQGRNLAATNLHTD